MKNRALLCGRMTSVRNSIVVALALTLTACQTAPLRNQTRSLAQAKIDSSTVDVLRSDAVELVGVYAHLVFLELVRERVELAKKLGRPVRVTPNSSAVASNALISTGGVLASSVIHIIFDASLGRRGSSENVERYQSMQKYFGNGSSQDDSFQSTGKNMRTAVLGGVSLAGATLAVVALSSPVDRQRDAADSVGSFQFVLRWDDVAQYAQSLSDAENAIIQAELVAKVKAAAQELSRRTATLFHMNGIESTRFAHIVEEKLLDAMLSETHWQPDQEVRVDVNAIVRQVMRHGEDRVEALTYVMGTAEEIGEPAVDFTSSAEICRWLDASEKGLRVLEKKLLATYNHVYESRKDLAMSALLPQYATLAQEIDELAVKLLLHSRLVACKEN